MKIDKIPQLTREEYVRLEITKTCISSGIFRSYQYGDRPGEFKDAMDVQQRHLDDIDILVKNILKKTEEPTL